MENEHTEQLNALKRRHSHAIEGFNDAFGPKAIQASTFELWLHKGLTTPVQFKLLTSLVDELEATQKAAIAASKNIKLGLETIIAAIPPGVGAAPAMSTR
jgi:hypothetical protein